MRCSLTISHLALALELYLTLHIEIEFITQTVWFLINMNRNCIAWLNINCVGYNCPAFNANSISWNLTGTPCNNQAINNGLKSDFFSLLKLRSYHSSGSNSGLVFMEISAKVFMKDIVLWQHFGRSENINSSQKRHTREVNKRHLMMLTLHICSPKNGDPSHYHIRRE